MVSGYARGGADGVRGFLGHAFSQTLGVRRSRELLPDGSDLGAGFGLRFWVWASGFGLRKWTGSDFFLFSFLLIKLIYFN